MLESDKGASSTALSACCCDVDVSGAAEEAVAIALGSAAASTVAVNLLLAPDNCSSCACSGGGTPFWRASACCCAIRSASWEGRAGSVEHAAEGMAVADAACRNRRASSCRGLRLVVFSAVAGTTGSATDAALAWKDKGLGGGAQIGNSGVLCWREAEM